MKTGNGDYRKIEEAFASTHGRRKVPEPSPSFDAHVMRRVRQVLAAEGAGPDGSISWDPLVWRLAASTCLVAVVLFAYAFLSGYGTEHEMTMAFLDNATDLIMVQSLGIL